MPTYEYRCKECGEGLEVVQSFSDDPLDTCPSCGGPLRKVFAAPGIAFKGSGFYKTDSKGKSSSTTPSSSTSSDSSSSSSDSTSSSSSSSDSSSSSGSGASTGSKSDSGSSSTSGTKESTPA